MTARTRTRPRRWWLTLADVLAVPVTRHHNRTVYVGRVA